MRSVAVFLTVAVVPVATAAILILVGSGLGLVAVGSLLMLGCVYLFWRLYDLAGFGVPPILAEHLSQIERLKERKAAGEINCEYCADSGQMVQVYGAGYCICKKGCERYDMEHPLNLNRKSKGA